MPVALPGASAIPRSSARWALRNGETMRFINDHDPIPLLGQIGQRFGEHVTVAYRQRDQAGVVIDFGVTGLPEE